MKKRILLTLFLLFACNGKVVNTSSTNSLNSQNSIQNQDSNEESSSSSSFNQDTNFQETSSSEEKVSSNKSTSSQSSTSFSSTSENKNELILSPSDLEYVEETNILNPERGFYKHLSIDLKTKNSSSRSTIPNDIAQNFGIVHLRVNLKEFSKNAGGSDSLISEDALNYLDKTIKDLKAKNVPIIPRFSYNLDGTKTNGNYIEAEPSMSLIKEHMKQIANVLNNNKEAILCLESGMLGPWGEQHSTAMATNKDYLVEVIDTWLSLLDKDIKINVRRPLYFVYWMNAHGYKECTVHNLKDYDYENIANAYRIGVFNDGYLGSDDDLGTYDDRENEILWLLNHSEKTLFGGEVETGMAVTQNQYCTSSYMINEAFKTHTSYLNIDYNTEVINTWKNQSYEGEDPAFKNKTGYNYIANHMGYRFFIKDCKLTKEIINSSQGKIEFVIENNGFASVTRDKKVKLLLENNNNLTPIDVNLDVKEFSSLTQTKVTINFDLSSSLEDGNYKIYLKISQDGEDYLPIKFSNKNIYNDKYNANYLGSFTLKNDKLHQENKTSIAILKSKSPLKVNGHEVLQRSSNVIFNKPQVTGNLLSLNSNDATLVDLNLNKGSYASEQYVDIPLTNYKDEYVNLEINFEASHDITLSLYIGWDNAIFYQKSFAKGKQVFNMNISSSDAYLNQMKGKSSFALRFFIQHNKTINEAQTLKIQNISLYGNNSKQHKITYISEGALGVNYVSYFPEGNLISLLDNYFVNENKTFINWIDQNNKTYQALQSINLNEDLILKPNFN